MPRFTIDLPTALLERLQPIVATYNANTGQALTVRDWIIQHLRELAIQEQLAAAVDALQKQKQEELAAAVDAARQKLLASL